MSKCHQNATASNKYLLPEKRTDPNSNLTFHSRAIMNRSQMHNIASSSYAPVRARVRASHHSLTPHKLHSDEEYQNLLDNLFYFWDPNPEYGRRGASTRPWFASRTDGRLPCQVEGCMSSFFSIAGRDAHMRDPTLHPVYKCARCPQMMIPATLFIIPLTKPDGSAAGMSYVCAKCNQTYYSGRRVGGGPAPSIIVLDDD